MDEVTCPRCGSTAVTKHGFQLFANPPHKRQRYICKNESCGHNFVPYVPFVLKEKDGTPVNGDKE